MKKNTSFKCAWLLAALLTQYLLQPYLDFFGGLGIPILKRLGSEMFSILLYNLTLLAAIYATSSDRLRVYKGISLVIPAMAFSWLTVLYPGVGWLVAAKAFFILLVLGYTIVCLLIYIFTSQAISLDQILGSISIYFLLGHGFSLTFFSLETLVPGSFAGLSVNSKGPDLMYYSFVTLTTLGYGDILPVSLQARSLAALEAVTGVLYVAILVARLIGLYEPHRR